MSKKTPWEKTIERRTANIGFLTRANGLREATPAEKDAALAIEIQSWQSTKGKKPYSLSAEYSLLQGHGFNLKSDWDSDLERPKDEPHRLAATKAYVETPMELVGRYKDLEIDLEVYKPKGFIQKVKNWFSEFFEKDLRPLGERYSFSELQKIFGNEEEK